MRILRNCCWVLKRQQGTFFEPFGDILRRQRYITTTVGINSLAVFSDASQDAGTPSTNTRYTCHFWRKPI